MVIKLLDESMKIFDTLKHYDFAQYSNRTREVGEFEINVVSVDSNMFLLDKSRKFYVLFDDEIFGRIDSAEEEQDNEQMKRVIKLKGCLSKQIFAERVIASTIKYKGNTAGFIEAVIKSEMVNNKNEYRNMDIQFVYDDEPLLESVCSLVDKEVTGGYIWENIQTFLEQDKLNMFFEPVVEATHLNMFGKPTNITKWIVRISAGVDRSKYNELGNAPVILSPDMHNIKRANYKVDIGKHRNVAYVAGEGEAEQRKWYEVFDKNTRMLLGFQKPDQIGWERRELWIDARDIQSETDDGQQMTQEQYDTLIIQRADEKFADNTMIEKYDSTLVQQDKRYTYGISFNEGDFVTVSDTRLSLETYAQITGIVRSVMGTQDIIDIELTYGSLRKNPIKDIPLLSEMISRTENDIKYIEGRMSKQQRELELIKNSSYEFIEGDGFEAKKYQDGRLEIAQTCSVPFVINTPWKTQYSDKYNLGKWKIPFVTVPRIISISNVSVCAMQYVCLDNSTPTSETEVGDAWFMRPDVANYPNTRVHFCVKATGRWK